MTRWIVDAWNVIGSRPDGWWRDRPGALARLVDEIIRWRDQQGEPVTIVVDGLPDPLGPPPGERSGVATRYTLTSARNAGDDAIVAALGTEPALDPDHHDVVVVSSDRDLVARAQAAGARTEGSAAFLRRLATPGQADDGPLGQDRSRPSATDPDQSRRGQS